PTCFAVLCSSLSVSADLFVRLLVILGPHLVSPLFPYTTLFRSRTCQSALIFSICSAVGFPSAATSACQLPPSTISVPRPAILVADRKSTRLNSSHDSISYAVFCLKKIIITTLYYSCPYTYV